MLWKEDGQEYAIITKVLGDSRMECECMDNTKRICHIRGKLHRRVWMSLGDVVLISTRDYQEEKGDIIHKYNQEEVKLLKAEGLLIIEPEKQNETTTTMRQGDEEFVMPSREIEISFDEI
jgi:translation initiation factor 1A